MPGLSPLVQMLVARQKQERDALSSQPIQELAKRLPNVFGDNQVETPAGAFDLGKLAGRDGSLTGAMFGGIDLEAARKPEGEGVQVLRDLMERLDPSKTFPAIDSMIEGLELKPGGFRQRARLRMARAMDPLFDQRQKIKKIELGNEMKMQVINNILRAQQELRLQTDDPAIEGFRREYMEKVGSFLGEEFGSSLRPSPEERYQQFLQDSGQQDSQSLRAAFMADAHDFKPDAKTDEVKRLADIGNIAKGVGGKDAVEILGQALELSDADRKFVERMAQQGDAERAEKVKKGDEDDLLDPLKVGTNLTQGAARLIRASERDVQIGEDANGDPKFRRVSMLTFVDAYRTYAKMMIGAGADANLVNESLSNFLGTLPPGVGGSITPEEIEAALAGDE